MSYETYGERIGSISLNARKMGVRTSDERALISTVQQMADIDAGSVMINNHGWLHCRCTSKTTSVIEKVHDKILKAIVHKAKTDHQPDTPPSRKPRQRPSYTNDPKRASRH